MGVPVSKVWNDANNQDGVRPESIQVQLYADGKASGEAITLPIEKEDGKKEWRYTKKWLDSDNRDGVRPGSIQVQLYAGNKPCGDPVTLPVVAADETKVWNYTWTNLDEKAAGKTITYTVKEVGESGGKIKFDNGSEYSVTVGGNMEDGYTIINYKEPEKREIAPHEGTGLLGNVRVGDEITYEITYRNYKHEAADVTIKDKLDENVQFVSADNGGTLNNGVVTWTLKNVAAGTEGKVTLTVKVLPGALTSNGGNGNVINGGDTATVKVGNDSEFTLNTVENPVPEKKETKPYEGTGLLGNVHVGDEITYEISYRNYKSEAADVIIKDKLDKNVEFVTASDNGVLVDGVVTWTLKEVEAGKAGTVSLTVKVLPGALTANGGSGNVVNDGDTATVQVGNDSEFTLNTVENPVPEKKETKPYEGTGLLLTKVQACWATCM